MIQTSWTSGWQRWVGSLLVLGALASSRVYAQAPMELPAPTADGEKVGPLPAEKIQELQGKAAAHAELTDEQKSKAAELAQQALTDIQTVEKLKKEAADYAGKIEQVSQQISDVQQQLQNLERAGEPKIDRRASVSELETERNAAQQEIAQLEAQLTTPDIDPTARTTRRRNARQFLIEFPTKLQQVKERLAAPPPEGEPAVMTALRQARTEWEREVLKERETAAQNELMLYDAEDAVGLPTARRDLTSRKLTALRKKVELYADQVNRLRQQEAEERVRQARDAAMRAQPLLKEILEANEQIAKEERDIRKEDEAVQQLTKELEQQVASLRKEYQDVENFDQRFGLSASMGLRLRQIRGQLPDLQLHQARRQARLETQEKAQFDLYRRSDQLDNLSDVDAAATALVAELTDLDATEQTQLREDAITALRAQEEYLEKLVNAYRSYTDALSQLDLVEQNLIRQTKEFRSFIDERVLWVRSHPPMGFADMAAELDAVSWLVDSSTWKSPARAIVVDAMAVPMLYGAVGALLVFLLVLHRRMGRRLHAVTKQARSRVSVSLLPTVQAIEFTMLSAIIWPGLMWFLSWRLWQSPEPRIVLVSAVTLSRLAALLLILEVVRQSMRPNGLCEAHFGMHGATARRIRQRLRQLIILGIPLAAAVALIHFYNGDERQAFVERLFFIASMLLLAFVAHTMFRRGHGDLRDLQSLWQSQWVGHLGFLWYVLAVGLPLTLAGLAVAGYYYSAQKLAIRCQISLCLFLGLIYLRAFLLRWLMLRHRRLRLQQLRDRQQAQQKEQPADDAGAPIPEAASEEADLDSISRQSQRLVSTTFVVACLIGVWMIWFEVVPALRFLERWPLWDYTVEVREPVENPDGTIDYPIKEVVQPVTIAHLVLAVLILVLTMTAARNLPGLLEITILQRLPIDRSTTYAVTALLRYSLVLFGIVLASRSLGIGWSKVQWLAAALTFGLGFGLQEIFANFVSGIIILFEQPVRVGDIVTIDGVSGVVNRIRIRATTITDWDRKEYIVPNREFITGRLLNWTLSDKMNRVLINIGVAHGSDTELVRETILRIAQEHENVLEDPAPLVTFEGIGENALNFVLRAYLPSLDNRLQTIHDLHSSIDRRLREAGIKIALPQRDLHLRTAVVLSEDGHLSSNGHRSPASRETVETTPQETHALSQ